MNDGWRLSHIPIRPQHWTDKTLNRHIPTSDIYLDHAATTPTDPGVVQAMAPYFTSSFGNPSSIYGPGQDARAAVDRARNSVARTLGCQPAEVIFTSGATESNNLALSGVAWAAKLADSSGVIPHVITTAIEHHAVLHSAEWLEQIGFEVTVVPCDEQGLVDPESVREAIKPATRLISVMYANNEIGSIQPVAAIASIAHEHGIPVHTDAVQAPGFLPLNVDDLGVDLLSLSAHKFYGPKAVGVLYVRNGTPIAYQQRGGGQESGRRGGTENVPSIVGLGMSLEMADADRSRYSESCRELRNGLWESIQEMIGGVHLNGPDVSSAHRLPNNLNLAIEGIQGETVLLSLDMLGVAASAGSACTTGNTQPSHVLTALGHPVERARSSLRLTTGRCNTTGDIEEAVDALAATVSRIRELAAR
ncbi:cysteine desulfurase NifS [soil metagenome]